MIMLAKRIVDILGSFLGLLLSSPVLLPVIFLVWYQDRHSPFYVAQRVGKMGQMFYMIKLRSMTVNADKLGIDSTAANDNRITPIGHFIRRYKLDELTQLLNVLKGDMSLVGPRPNVKRETDLYTIVEREVLSVTPGITDIASIVFSDEGDILKNEVEPDIAYNQLIRPWKSRLALLYVKHSNLKLDIHLIILTIISIFSRRVALNGVCKILTELRVDNNLLQIASRMHPLYPSPPPGAIDIVRTRDI